MGKKNRGKQNAAILGTTNQQQPGPSTSKRQKVSTQQTAEPALQQPEASTSEVNKLLDPKSQPTFTNWDEDSMDYESSLPPSQRTKNPHGKKSSLAAPSQTPLDTSPAKLGNSEVQPTPINNVEATTITRTPKFVASIPSKAFRGISIHQILAQVQTMMISHAGFLKATHNFRKHCIDVHFDSRSALEAMINSPDSKIDNYQFKAVPSLADRQTEKGRTVRVTDIPLYIKSSTIYEHFKKMGNVDRFSMITRGRWQVAYVVYENTEILKPLYDACWAVHIMDFQARLYPTDLSEEQFNLRKQYCLKLTGLPNGCSHKTINDIYKQSGAASCIIPRDDKYKPRRYAYFHFKSQQDLDKAKSLNFKFYDFPLHWISPTATFCFRCGSPVHDLKSCDQQNKDAKQNTASPFKALYERFRPAQYRPDKKKNNPTKVSKPLIKLSPVSKPKQQKPNNRKQPSYADVVQTSGQTSEPTFLGKKLPLVIDESIPNDINQKLDNILILLTTMQEAIANLQKFETFAYARFTAIRDQLETIGTETLRLAQVHDTDDTDSDDESMTDEQIASIRPDQDGEYNERDIRRITRSRAAQYTNVKG